MKPEADHKTLPREWDPQNQQIAFRKLMTTFAFPGHIETLAPEAPSKTFSVLRMILATLTDGEVTVADPYHMIDAYDWSKLETNKETPEKARFIVAQGDVAPLFSPELGTLESPETGATIILRVEQLGTGSAFMLQGPGIQAVKHTACSGLDLAWLCKRQEWNGSFPLGVDMIFFDAARVMAVPRTTRITTKEGN